MKFDRWFDEPDREREVPHRDDVGGEERVPGYAYELVKRCVEKLEQERT